MNLKELSEYKKNLDELKSFRAIGLTPAQMRLALDGAQKALKDLSLFHRHGIWPDNVHLFQKADLMEDAPLPLNLYADDSKCIFCGEEIAVEGSLECWNCQQKGKGYV